MCTWIRTLHTLQFKLNGYGLQSRPTSLHVKASSTGLRITFEFSVATKPSCQIILATADLFGMTNFSEIV